jgi:hypothetical protein
MTKIDSTRSTEFSPINIFLMEGKNSYVMTVLFDKFTSFYLQIQISLLLLLSTPQGNPDII